ncbi:hypothetical protein CAPTEDRAFT_174324 [Capitella teleta]|uniref:RecQ-mediated genome instability protein 1 n=1 Tax=Capitella teleta TaxID=283909 RepID=R7VA11_CAPTE|nr:hypothetical protein CAPTEDRAFT_174324 [Capitella teleta]|eukprot:ELU15357.1 hypothetical protein CAPTEDRAFT_174324 [Capitella teleta]
MLSLVSSVRQWLLQQRKLKVPDDWLEACVDWIQSEHQGPGPLRTSDVNSLVYEQWLVCDLREIEASCLPANLKQQTKVPLSGIFNLQINSVVDVGAPFYGQLQKVRGTDNANVEVTATQATQAARWEPKPSRMLMLSVTDGTHDVKIMEYRPIQCLDVNITPGTKIQVSGNVFCRLGVIMAQSQNIKVLGGEVDSLAETNTPESVLTNAL